jgi:hypothetical protein
VVGTFSLSLSPRYGVGRAISMLPSTTTP